jgi:hypothetical protein
MRLEIRCHITLSELSGKFRYKQVVLTLNLCILYESENKQQLLPYTALTDWFL